MKLNALSCAKGLILLQAWGTASSWLLSWVNQFNPLGFSVATCATLFVAFPWILKSFPKALQTVRWQSWMRYPHRLWRRPSLLQFLPFWFFLFAGLAFAGGSIYPPTLYDALTYRLPRVLAWWMENHWFWIPTPNDRQNLSAPGFEWATATLFLIFRTDRLLFLPNILGYLLLPGLFFSAARSFGLPSKMSWIGMWFLPLGYCFVCQAASIGNDHYGAVFALSTLALAGQMKKYPSVQTAFWPILAAALLTNIKASNVALAPCLLTPLIGKLLRLLTSKPMTMLAITIFALSISFLPTAILNQNNAGHWSGAVSSDLKIKKPIAGLVGNLFQVSQDNLAPPVLPPAMAINRWLKSELEPSSLMRWIHSGFPRFSIGFRELLQEEGTGIGPFHFLLFLFALLCVFARPLRPDSAPTSDIMLIGFFSLAALLALFTQLGTEAAARIIAPFYPPLFLLTLSLLPRSPVSRHPYLVFWVTLAALSAMPLSILNPSRPKIPAPWILACVERIPGLPSSSLNRIRLVYQVYASRNDPFHSLRKHIPENINLIGLINSGDDNETSLWRPYGHRRVLSVFEETANPKVFPDTEAWIARRHIADALTKDTVWSKTWIEKATCPITLKASVGVEDWVLFLRR